MPHNARSEIEEGSTGGARIASHRQRARAALPGRRRAAGRRRAGAGRPRDRGWPDRRPAAGGRRRAGARREHHRSGRRRGLAGPGRPATPISTRATSGRAPRTRMALSQPRWRRRTPTARANWSRRRRARALRLRAALRVRARHGRDPHPSRKPAAACTRICWPVFRALQREWAGRIDLQAVGLVPIEDFARPSGEAIADLVARPGRRAGRLPLHAPRPRSPARAHAGARGRARPRPRPACRRERRSGRRGAAPPRRGGAAPALRGPHPVRPLLLARDAGAGRGRAHAGSGASRPGSPW